MREWVEGWGAGRRGNKIENKAIYEELRRGVENDAITITERGHAVRRNKMVEFGPL